MKAINQSKRKNASTIVSEVSLTKHNKVNKESRFYILLTKANIDCFLFLPFFLTLIGNSHNN